MTVINFVGGLINSNVGHFQGNLSDFPSTITFVAIFCVLYLFTTLIKTKINAEYRLPIIRVAFWTLVIAIDLMHNSNSLHTFDYLLALINGGLCLFYNTLLFKIYNGGTGNTYFEIYGYGIFIFAAYEFLILKTSTVLADKLIGKKLKINSL
jgi:hypothetical protein